MIKQKKLNLASLLLFIFLPIQVKADEHPAVRDQVLLDLTSLEAWALSDLLNPEVEKIAEFRMMLAEIPTEASLEEYEVVATLVRNFALRDSMPNLCSQENFGLCTEDDICIRATVSENGNRRWAEQTATNFVNFARSKNFSCSVPSEVEPLPEGLALEYLVILTEYVSRNTSEFDLEFAERFNSVRPILSGSWSNELSETFESFRVYADQNSGFKSEWEQLQERKRLEQSERVSALRAELSSKLSILNEWALRNIIDPKAAEIATLLRAAEDITVQNVNDLTYFLDRADALFLATGIGQQISPSELSNGLDKLFNPFSIYLIANLTPAAENMYVNISGDIALYGNVGSYCYSSKFESMEDYIILLELNETFSDASLTKNDCTPRTDIIVAKGEDLTSRNIIDGLPMDSSNVLAEISPGDREQAMSLLDFDSRRIASDINTGSRIGYGVISFSNNSTRLCALVDSNLEAHSISLFDKKSLLLAYDIIFDGFVVSFDSAETVFRALQRNECRAIYSDASNLHSLSIASMNNGFSSTFIPLWVSERQVEVSRLAIEAEIRALAEAEQSFEERLRLEAETVENALEQAAAQQQRLREAHDLEFRAITDNVLDLVEESIAFGYAVHPLREDYELRYAELRGLDPTTGLSVFEPIIEDMHRASSEGWEITKIDLVREDFGQAKFGQRSTTGVVFQVQVDMRNAIIGRYENYCRRLMLIDDEIFSMLRRVHIAACSDNAILQNWRIEQSFNSLWVVEAQ